MGSLENIHGKVVGLDTTPLIYFIEKNPTFHPIVRPFFLALNAGQLMVVTSTITLTETLVHPLRNKRQDLASRYQDILLHSANVTTYDLTPAIATYAAEIRAEYNFRTPDAIQLATAVQAGATYFLTNDRALKRFTLLQVYVVEDMQT